MASQDIQIIRLPLEAPPHVQGKSMAMIVGLALLVCAPGFVLMAYDDYARRAQIDNFWRVEGQACTPVNPTTFHGMSWRASTARYDGAVYQRNAGGMTCSHRTDKIDGAAVRYPVCKFDSPDFLSVTVGGRERIYDLTMGRSVAIGVVNGQVRCAVTERFEM